MKSLNERLIELKAGINDINNSKDLYSDIEKLKENIQFLADMTNEFYLKEIENEE